MSKEAKNNVKNNVGDEKKERPQNKHLKPIKPGEVRNPTGRPKGVLNYKTRLNIALDALALQFADAHNAKYADAIKNKKRKAMDADEVDIMGDVFTQFVNKARNGDLKAIDSLLDRTYGKAKQPVEVSGKDGKPIEYTVKVKEAEERLKRFQSKWFKQPATKKPAKK